jgi:hypothetical protein
MKHSTAAWGCVWGQLLQNQKSFLSPSQVNPMSYHPISQDDSEEVTLEQVLYFAYYWECTLGSSSLASSDGPGLVLIPTSFLFFFFFCVIWLYWSLNSGSHAC